VQKKLKELLIRLLYVEMLGHDASFGYIKAIEMTASTNLLQKRVGYLCASLTLAPEHEFRFMLINQLQRVSKSIFRRLSTTFTLAIRCRICKARITLKPALP
jgi:AP-4 complex subunit epsilon-1